mmetsp:Transcript_122723/g.216249  ORF Transcript_122723/g.216249 Transcript_122723/m.216249 type:complete len:257 (+) Transcript_122723:1-771(+)
MDSLAQSMAKRHELKPLVVRKMSSRSLGLVVLDSFLSSVEVEAASNAVRRANISEEPLYEYGHDQAVLAEHTNAAKIAKFVCTDRKTPHAIRSICAKVASTMGLDSQYLEPGFHVRIYKRGERVAKHVDQVPGWEFKYCGRRTFAFLVHLGTAQGGDTRFLNFNGSGHDYNVGVKPGRAIIFPVVDASVHGELDPNSDQETTSPEHEGEPVTSGEKMLMTFWFRQFPYTAHNHGLCCGKENPFASLLDKVQACSCA